jgi:mannosylglycerate hydrolase
VPSADAAFEVVDAAGTALPARIVRLEEQEVAYQVLDRTGLLALLGSVQGGRSSGRAIVGLQLRRENEVLYLDVAVAEAGEPDPAVVAQGLAQLQAALADPTLVRFVVRARSYRATFEFLASDVPGHGYRTYWLHSLSPRHPVTPSSDQGTREGEPGKRAAISNEVFSLESAPDGTLTLVDKRTGARFGGLNRFVDGGDAGDEYDYAPPAVDTVVGAYPTAVTTWSDGVGQSLRVDLEMALPAGLAEGRTRRSAEVVVCRVRTTARLLPGVPRVDITTEVDNLARDHRLRVHFPVPLAVTAADYDGHFHVVRRPVGVPEHDATWAEDPRPEVPQRAFCDVSDGETGLLLANRGLPEVAVLPSDGGSEIALTLLRCVGWLSRADFSTRRGHAGPAAATPGAQEIGRHRFEYAVIPHAGDWTAAYPEAYAFDVPLRAVDTLLHAGTLPAAAAFLAVQPPAFVLSAVKPAEDGTGVIVRGYNITGEPIRATLAPFRRFARAARVRLDEEEVAELPLAEDGSIDLEVRGHEIVTVGFAPT